MFDDENFYFLLIKIRDVWESQDRINQFIFHRHPTHLEPKNTLSECQNAINFDTSEVGENIVRKFLNSVMSQNKTTDDTWVRKTKNISTAASAAPVSWKIRQSTPNWDRILIMFQISVSYKNDNFKYFPFLPPQLNSLYIALISYMLASYAIKSSEKLVIWKQLDLCFLFKWILQHSQ